MMEYGIIGLLVLIVFLLGFIIIKLSRVQSAPDTTANLIVLEKNQERLERILQEEISKNRAEGMNNSRAL
ncbi:MAG: hypothetical protein H6Q65_2400, partial [Firmicutes bacterium]|nr:hypothetical protein [Bacillota bacterium]